MFDGFYKRKDAEAVELEEKLDKDLLEQMLFALKDESFYTDPDSLALYCKVDLTVREPNKPILYLDRCYDVLHRLQDCAEESLMNEYDPSKRAKKYIKALRNLSLSTQVSLFSVESKKHRIQRLAGDIDTEIFVLLTRFRISACQLLKEIFESYDIRVYPKLIKGISAILSTAKYSV